MKKLLILGLACASTLSALDFPTPTRKDLDNLHEAAGKALNGGNNKLSKETQAVAFALWVGLSINHHYDKRSDSLNMEINLRRSEYIKDACQYISPELMTLILSSLDKDADGIVPAKDEAAMAEVLAGSWAGKECTSCTQFRQFLQRNHNMAELREQAKKDAAAYTFHRMLNKIQ